jgi:hypothetical protein
MVMAIDPIQKNRIASLRISDRSEWVAALQGKRPVLVHLNADTTWLVQLPRPSSSDVNGSRTHFNLLLDPWLKGPQSDVASWFSTQWHIVAPCIQTIAELNQMLRDVETDLGHGAMENECFIDVVAISHEFTDHCHQATLLELPKAVPVYAADLAADLIRSWKHFDNVITTPSFLPTVDVAGETPHYRLLPRWVRISRMISANNALYYHSAIVVTYDLQGPQPALEGHKINQKNLEAIVYSPHGIKAVDLQPLGGSGIRTVAFLHGLHDVRIWLTKQLNLGALNGIEAVREVGAKYWVATHDEIKKGGGFIAPLLRRTIYTLQDAVASEEKKIPRNKKSEYNFIELGPGDGLILQ